MVEVVAGSIGVTGELPRIAGAPDGPVDLFVTDGRGGLWEYNAGAWQALFQARGPECCTSRTRDRIEGEERQAFDRALDRIQAERSAHEQEPVAWLESGLRLLTSQWTGSNFFADGPGLGRVALRGSVAALVAAHGAPTAHDIAHGACQRVLQTPAVARLLGPQGCRSLAAMLDVELAKHPTPSPTPDCAGQLASAILTNTRRNARSPPSIALPN